jgi:hypothetical protein
MKLLRAVSCFQNREKFLLIANSSGEHAGISPYTQVRFFDARNVTHVSAYAQNARVQSTARHAIYLQVDISANAFGITAVLSLVSC